MKRKMEIRTENQYSVGKWAYETFGETTALRSAVRANNEMSELLTKLSIDDTLKASEEIADIIICLFRLSCILGVDIDSAIDAKMCINRSREWELDGYGNGQHK